MARVALLCAPGVVAGQRAGESPFAAPPLLSLEQVAQERARFLPWLDSSARRLSPDELQQAREHLYLLIGETARAQFRATGQALPARDTLGLAELFEYATRLGLPGSARVARALLPADSPLPPGNEAQGTLSLDFAAPEYTLRSAHGWSVRFPYYVMVSAAQSGVPRNGVETEYAMLSTLHAEHRGQPGASQATVLLVAAEPESAQAFVDFWLANIGVGAGDRASDAPLAGATVYRQTDAATQMRKEVVTLSSGKLVLVIGYFGLPGTFEANRPDFLRLLTTLSLPARRGQ